jgi:hypothetical protein
MMIKSKRSTKEINEVARKWKCKNCQVIVGKEINKEPGEIVGRYLCKCKHGPEFPLIPVEEK